MNKQEAKQIALESTQKYDFDAREVLSCEVLGADALDELYNRASTPKIVRTASDYYEVVVRVFCSDGRIASLTGNSDSAEEIEMKREFLGRGSKVRVIVVDGGIVREELLGVQLS